MMYLEIFEEIYWFLSGQCDINMYFIILKVNIGHFEIGGQPPLSLILYLISGICFNRGYNFMLFMILKNFETRKAWFLWRNAGLVN